MGGAKEAGGSCSWVTCYNNFEFCCFLGCFFFSCYLKKYGRWFLVSAFHAKRWLLTSFLFFDFLIFMFKVTPMLLHFFTPQRFNARKCSLCQTLACTDRRSHKQKLLLLWGKKLLKKDLGACIKHIFFHSRNFRKHRKGLSCICLPVTKVFDISPWYLPFFWFTPKGFFKKNIWKI